MYFGWVFNDLLFDHILLLCVGWHSDGIGETCTGLDIFTFLSNVNCNNFWTKTNFDIIVFLNGSFLSPNTILKYWKWPNSSFNDFLPWQSLGSPRNYITTRNHKIIPQIFRGRFETYQFTSACVCVCQLNFLENLAANSSEFGYNSEYISMGKTCTVFFLDESRGSTDSRLFNDLPKSLRTSFVCVRLGLLDVKVTFSPELRGINK